MISCADFLAEIGGYLEGDLAEAVRARIEGHLAHCKHCTVLLDSSRKTIKVVTDSESFELPEEAFQPIISEVMARIRKGTAGH